MKERLKNLWKCIVEFTKKNKMSCICFLLAILVALTGTMSLAKYVSGAPVNQSPGTAGMYCSSAVTGVSALSFTNTNFWGGDSDTPIAMNSLRSIDIVVNNFEVDSDGNKRVSDVRTEYELVFTAPKAFAENLAFQVLDAYDHAITTQMVMGHFFESLNQGHIQHKAEGKAQYNGVDFVDDEGNIFNLMFEIDHYADTEDHVHAVATAYHPEDHSCPYAGEKIIITIDETVETVEQTLMFRAWDTSGLKLEKVESESGTLMPPARVVISTEVPMYRVSVRMDKHFVMEAGEEKSKPYIMTIAPTEALQDDHMGAYICVEQKVGNETNYVTPETLKTGDEVYFSAIRQTLYKYTGTPGDYNEDDFTTLYNSTEWTEGESYHVAAVKTYNPGETVSTETKPLVESNPVSDIAIEGSTSTETMTIPLYFNRSYSYGSGYTYNLDESNSGNANVNPQSRNHFKVVYNVNKKTTVSYSEVSGKLETNGTKTTTITSLGRSGDDYILKIETKTTETSNKYTNIAAVKTTTVTYELGEYTIYERNNNTSWKEISNAQIGNYNGMSDGVNTFMTENYPTQEAIDNVTLSDIVNTPKTETTTEYQKVTNERLPDSGKIKIVSLSQMIYNDNGKVGTIYYGKEGTDIIATDDDGNTYIVEKYLPYLSFFGPNPDDASKMIQTLYLSTCYSKDYPVAVRVTFRQIQ